MILMGIYSRGIGRRIGKSQEYEQRIGRVYERVSRLLSEMSPRKTWIIFIFTFGMRMLIIEIRFLTQLIFFGLVVFFFKLEVVKQK